MEASLAKGTEVRGGCLDGGEPLELLFSTSSSLPPVQEGTEWLTHNAQGLVVRGLL